MHFGDVYPDETSINLDEEFEHHVHDDDEHKDELEQEHDHEQWFHSQQLQQITHHVHSKQHRVSVMVNDSNGDENCLPIQKKTTSKFLTTRNLLESMCMFVHVFVFLIHMEHVQTYIHTMMHGHTYR